MPRRTWSRWSSHGMKTRSSDSPLQTETAKRNSFTHQPVRSSPSLKHAQTTLALIKKKRKKRKCEVWSHIDFSLTFTFSSAITLFRLLIKTLDRKETKANVQGFNWGGDKFTHSRQSLSGFDNGAGVVITKIYWHRQFLLLSPVARVSITSSKILALSSSLLAMRRTVYTVPDSSPSIMWKLWEAFTASEIRQFPSPTQPSTESAQAASLY